MRLIITEEEKDDILSKYKGDTNDEFLKYLETEFPVGAYPLPKYFEVIDDFLQIALPYVLIDKKMHHTYDNKKYLVNKIFYTLGDDLPHIPTDVKRRTIKKYLDSIRSTQYSMKEFEKIKKLLDIVNKKYLDKIFDKPIPYEIGSIEVVANKHYIIDILIPTYYLNNEPYKSKINEWWYKLMKVQEFYHHMDEEGSVNFQPIEKK
jgi:hypothetical protein